VTAHRPLAAPDGPRPTLTPGATIFGHTAPHGRRPLFLRPDRPPRFDGPLTRSDLEFIMEQIAALRREQAKLAFVILFVGAVLGIVGIEAFWRYFPACGSI
jgi:hypothetical protein